MKANIIFSALIGICLGGMWFLTEQIWAVAAGAQNAENDLQNQVTGIENKQNSGNGGGVAGTIANAVLGVFGL